MGHCHALGLSFLLLPVAVAPAAAENTSAYTRLDLAACRSIPPDPDDPLQSGEWWCDGHGNWPVHVTEGDLRFFVSYGEDALDQPAAGTTLPAFNHLGPTIEWRIDGDGTALATILRWYTSSGDGGPDGQTLVITRLGGPGEVCHVGYVDARTNPDANAIARDVADNGARFSLLTASANAEIKMFNVISMIYLQSIRLKVLMTCVSLYFIKYKKK